MKRFLTVLAAAAAVVLACAFVACKNDDDGGSGGGGSVVSEWGYVGVYYTSQPDENDYEVNTMLVFTFYSGGKVDVKYNNSPAYGNDLYTGTYTGDTTKPGATIKLDVVCDNDERVFTGTVTDGGNLIEFSDWMSKPENAGTQSAYQTYYIGKIQ